MFAMKTVVLSLVGPAQAVLAWSQSPVLALLALVLLAAALVLAWRRGRLGIAFLAVTFFLGCAWTLSKIAIDHDYRDADGYVDCWPSCTPLQNAVALGLFFAPIAWFALGVLAAVLAALTGPRGRRWKPLDRNGSA
jgi:hypothetical protein